MTNLSLKEIEKFASKKGVKRIAVENFLMTLTGSSYADNVNLSMDAKMYKWNNETVKAIRQGFQLNIKKEMVER